MTPMSAKTQSIGGSYRSFIFPGIVGMTLLFTSIFVGISVIWDRKFGFMKEILVAPISRVSIILGKALGGSTCAMIQGTLLLLFGFIIKVHLSIFSFILCLPIMFLISFGLVTTGFTIASLMDSLEGFNMIMSFVIMPMFFLSGALFPLKNVPSWLRSLSVVDPYLLFQEENKKMSVLVKN
jgi:ABC-2 type transport system permease protein